MKGPAAAFNLKLCRRHPCFVLIRNERFQSLLHELKNFGHFKSFRRQTLSSLLIRGQQLRLSDLLETREAIEPFCARLAARHRTDADLAHLDEANEALADEAGSLAKFLQANVDWHLAVATASHNELLAGLMTALSRAIYSSTENDRFVDEKVRRETARAHRSITKAIRAQDADAAVRRMERHVYAYASAVVKVEKRTEISVPGDD